MTNLTDYYDEKIAAEAARRLAQPELKPCPFCGGAPRIKHLINTGIRSHSRVECTNCHIKTDYYVHEFGERNVIKVWNTRACDECERGAIPATEENMAEHGWVRERTCHKVVGKYGHRWSCSECDETLLPKYPSTRYPDGIVSYCPSCGAKVVEE